MIIQILDNVIKARVRKNDKLLLELAELNQVKVDTVKRWIREDDVILTTTTNLEIIRVGLSISEDVVMTEPKELVQQN